MHTKFVRGAAALALGSLVLGGCQSMQNRERGAVIGAAVGGAAGGVIGKHQGSTAKQNIPGAVVERVGEGIQVTFESGLLFDFDSDRVKPTAQANLRTLANSLEKYPNSSLLIVGHTDAKGSDDYNMNLSQRRASSAASFLVSQGVAAGRLRTLGLGETEPVAPNDSEMNMAKNRRVEVAIYASEAYRNSLRSQ